MLMSNETLKEHNDNDKQLRIKIKNTQHLYKLIIISKTVLKVYILEL